MKFLNTCRPTQLQLGVRSQSEAFFDFTYLKNETFTDYQKKFQSLFIPLRPFLSLTVGTFFREHQARKRTGKVICLLRTTNWGIPRVNSCETNFASDREPRKLSSRFKKRWGLPVLRVGYLWCFVHVPSIFASQRVKIKCWWAHAGTWKMLWRERKEKFAVERIMNFTLVAFVYNISFLPNPVT